MGYIEYDKLTKNVNVGSNTSNLVDLDIESNSILMTMGHSQGSEC